MKNDKFCVSKTLAYLVALVAVVVGGFYVMNYVNSQNLAMNSQAAPAKCTWATVKSYPAGCGVTSGGNKGLSTAMGTKFTEDASRNYKSGGTLVSRCCVGVKADVTPAVAGAKTCKQLGGSGWYSDTSAANLQARLNTGSPANKAVVTEVTGTFSDPQTGRKCYRITYDYSAGAGAQTCKQKGGSDWYRESTKAALEARLNAGVPSTGNKAVATAITGSFSDQQPNRYCYKITYSYGTASTATQTCKQQGGSDWFRESTETALEARLNANLTGYKADATQITGSFTDQIPNRYCYAVRYTEVADTTCQGQGGVWFSYSSCSAAETAWDPNGTTSEVISTPSFSYTDTRSGSVCCVRN